MERRSIAEWERELGVPYQTLVYLARRAKIYSGKPRGSGAVLLAREQVESLVPRAQALEALREQKRGCHPGARFGKLTVVERGGAMRGHQRWICRCDCGDTTIVTRARLTRGITRSCGKPSCREWRPSGKPRKYPCDLTGQRRGKLTVLERDTSTRHSQWRCRCDCGRIVLIYGSSIANRRSCGSVECAGSAAHSTGPKRGKTTTKAHGTTRNVACGIWR